MVYEIIRGTGKSPAYIYIIRTPIKDMLSLMKRGIII